jgi:hypothetical protein
MSVSKSIHIEHGVNIRTMIKLILSKSPAYHLVSRPFINCERTVLSSTGVTADLRSPNLMSQAE